MPAKKLHYSTIFFLSWNIFLSWNLINIPNSKLGQRSKNLNHMTMLILFRSPNFCWESQYQPWCTNNKKISWIMRAKTPQLFLSKIFVPMVNRKYIWIALRAAEQCWIYSFFPLSFIVKRIQSKIRISGSKPSLSKNKY